VPQLVPLGHVPLAPHTTRSVLVEHVEAHAVDVYDAFCPWMYSVPQQTCPEGQSSGPSHAISTPKVQL